MINLEPQILSAVAGDLLSSFPSLIFEGSANYSPAKFPYVCGEEADNYVYTPSRDSNSNENNVVLMYEFNVFTNSMGRKKAEATDIIAVLDATMNRLGFTRTTKKPFNYSNATVYRVVLRYMAVADAQGNIYWR